MILKGIVNIVSKIIICWLIGVVLGLSIELLLASVGINLMIATPLMLLTLVLAFTKYRHVRVWK